MARKKHYVKKMDYAEEYWNKNEEKLKAIFPLGKDQFESVVKNTIEDSKFLGKARAKQEFDDMVARRKYGSEYVEMRQALREYARENNIKMSKFNNKKFGEEVAVDIDAGDYSTEWAADGKLHINSYTEISGTDLVVVKGVVQLDTGSPVNIKFIMTRGELGV